jgi:hypothetical protein
MAPAPTPSHTSLSVPPVGGAPTGAPVGPALRPRPIVPTGETSRRYRAGWAPPTGGMEPHGPWSVVAR